MQAPAQLPLKEIAQRALEGVWLFEGLNESLRAEIAEMVRLSRYAARERIFDAGFPGDSMMIVHSGRIRIYLPMASGKEVILTDLGPREVFGEVSLIDGRDRSASAKALTKCELMVLDRSRILPFLAQRADLCMRLLDILCGRLRRSDERMADIGFASLPARLAKLLLQRVSDFAESSRRTRISLSQSELAGLIGGTRENVNRCLANWQQCRVITTDKGWINILDMKALKKIADSGA